MNTFQIVYSLALLALVYPAWGRHRQVVLLLLANLLATLGACLAMDLDAIPATDARLLMMQIDLITGVALAMRPGLARVIAIGYMVNVFLYRPWIDDGFTRNDLALTVIYVVNALQIGALAFGTFGDHSGGGKRRGLSPRRFPLAISLGGDTVLPGHVSAHSGEGLETR